MRADDPTAGSAFGLARGGHDAGSQADGAVASALVGRNDGSPGSMRQC
jgi:hypothetical protein